MLVFSKCDLYLSNLEGKRGWKSRADFCSYDKQTFIKCSMPTCCVVEAHGITFQVNRAPSYGSIPQKMLEVFQSIQP